MATNRNHASLRDHRKIASASAAALALALLALAPLSGCGSGTTGATGGGNPAAASGPAAGTGRAVFSVAWPQASASAGTGRLVPAAAASIAVAIRRADGSVVAQKVIDRPADAATFDNLPALGDLVAVASAHPAAGGQGVPQASGSVGLAIRAGQTTAVTLTMGSTVAALSIAAAPGAPLAVGQQGVTLAAAAADAAGNAVLVAPAALRWTSDDPAVAAVDAATGAVTAVAAGQTTIRVADTESGRQAGVLVTVAAAPAGFAYTVVDLGVLPGDTTSIAWDINNNGQIVGSSFQSLTATKAFFWRDPSEGMLLLEGSDATALKINDRGQIAGRSDKGPNAAPTFWEAYNVASVELRFSRSDGVPQQNAGYADALNERGQVAGADTTRDEAAYWESKTALPREGKQVSPFQHSTVRAMNDAGLLAGYGSDVSGSLEPQRAYLWKPRGNGTWEQVSISDAATTSLAFGMNQAGKVVGRYGTKGFVWQEGGPLTELPGLGGSTPQNALYSGIEEELDGDDRVCAAFDINAGEWIVGDATLPSNARRACLWRRDPATGAWTVTDLNSRIDPASGWALESARAINDGGRIVGYGRLRGGGNPRAFLLIPR